MRIWVILLLFSFYNLNAQDFKEGISIVQFSAPFTQEAEVSLKSFKRYNIYTFCITEKGKIFDSEKIKYLPTVLVYHNNEEVLRIESGISLKLPENTLDQIDKKIEQIIESKF